MPGLRQAGRAEADPAPPRPAPHLLGAAPVPEVLLPLVPPLLLGPLGVQPLGPLVGPLDAAACGGTMSNPKEASSCRSGSEQTPAI